MKKEKPRNEAEIREFITLTQSLSREQQAGLLVIIKGAELMSCKKKKSGPACY